jgi:hypothetical protein
MEEVFIYTSGKSEPIITLAKRAQKYTDPKTHGRVQGTTNVVKSKIKSAIGKTTGCINTIKCLSPKPSEFITTASEFLFNQHHFSEILDA